MSNNCLFHVVPAKAGTQGKRSPVGPWTPAFAGVTDKVQLKSERGVGQGE